MSINENLDEASNKAVDASSNRGRATHNFMMPKKIEIPDKKEEQSLSSEPPQEFKPKEVSCKKRTASVDYTDLFLCRYELESRQGLHVEKETIATIKRIVHGIGNERLTVSGFVENVLKHHFEIYKDEVNRLFEEKYRKPFE